MNVGEEKVFLYGMMKDITEERRRLTDMYFSLKERVDELHKLEEKGLSEISTKGFIDLFNDRETQIRIANVNREMQYAKEREKELMKPRYDKVAETLERGQADREAAEKEKAIQKAKAEVDEEETVQKSLYENEQVKLRFEPDNANERISKMSEAVLQQFAEAKEIKDSKPVHEVDESVVYNGKGRPPKGWVKPKAEEKPKSKSTILRENVTTPEIGRILRQNGIMKVEEIRTELEKRLDVEIPKPKFSSNTLYKALKNDPKIERVGSGLYQYAKG